MQSTPPDAFALKNSGLDAFLYADVGMELNGSPLTILSVLARLGIDPWAQAAGWAALPTAGAIEGLSQSIAQMPLTPVVLAESRAIAERLVQLLPGKPRPVGLAKTGAAEPIATTPSWSPVTMICCGVAVWMVLSMLMTPKSSTTEIASIEQPMAIPESGFVAAVPLEHHASIVQPAAPALR